MVYRDESNTLPILSRVESPQTLQLFHRGYWGHNLLTSSLFSPFFSPYAVTHPAKDVLDRFSKFLQVHTLLNKQEKYKQM
jgi:hypothetical protein